MGQCLSLLPAKQKLPTMEYAIISEMGVKGRNSAVVKNPDKNSDAYYVDFRGSSDIIVRRGSKAGPVVGRVKFHLWTGYTEVWFENNFRIEIARDGIFTSAHTFNLPAAPHSPYTWKHTYSHGAGLKGGRMKLEDAKGTMIALYARTGEGRAKDGLLTLKDSEVGSVVTEELKDQIFVTFLAIEEKQRRSRRSSGGASGSTAATTTTTPAATATTTATAAPATGTAKARPMPSRSKSTRHPPPVTRAAPPARSKSTRVAIRKLAEDLGKI